MTEALTGMIPGSGDGITRSPGGEQPKEPATATVGKRPITCSRCLGEEKWVAVSVETDAQFRALAQAASNPGWADDARFATPAARLENQDALESLVQQWTAGQDVAEVVAILQDAGVPAAPVSDTAEVLADPHLTERGFRRPDVEHPVAGARPVLSLPWAADGRRVDDLRPAPTFGQHNQWVLKELLQLPDEEYQRLLSSGAIG